MNIFITGATGYIGGSIANLLQQQGHAISGLVRDEAKANLLAARGIAPIIGTLDDGALLTAAAHSADAVINAASSDHRSAVESLLAGLRGSDKPFIHTSGSSIISDDARGERLSDDIFDDEHPFVAGGHPHAKPRYALDLDVIDAARAGIRSIVICPTLVYGTGTGLHADSVQVPMLVKEAKSSGAVHIIGKGLNRWSNVHIADLANLYGLALAKAPAGAFYFAENGEASFGEIGNAIARRLGLGPVEFWNVDEATPAWGPRFPRSALGSNCRVRGLRARRELGWSPQHSSAVEWISKDMPG